MTKSDAGQLVKTALFLDFDNVYLSLVQVNPQAAEIFASNPEAWLDWISRGGHTGEDDAAPRAILIRRCYLNPQTFWRFRAHFTRSAFSVVDCPPLTSTKNSGDIYMVMDILDALDHPTRFDEFIILSADADFTPVLLRLRAHDRRTAILANQLAASAFKAACDIVIDLDDFIEEALGLRAVGQGYDWLLPQVAHRLRASIEAEGPMDASALATVFREFPAFLNSSWFGFGKLRPLADRLVELDPLLALIITETGSWEVGLAHGAQREAGALRHGGGTRAEIIEAARKIVLASPMPVLLASLGNELANQLGSWVKQGRWGGAGTLSALLESAQLSDIALSETNPLVAYVPGLHEVGDFGDPRLADLPPELASLMERVGKLTGCPRLLPEDFQATFEEIAALANEDPDIVMNEASRLIRDRLAQRGIAIGRSAINFILQGLRFNGYTMDRGDDSVVVRDAFSDNVKRLCENAGVAFNDEEERLFQVWMAAPSAQSPDEEVVAEGEEQE